MSGQPGDGAVAEPHTGLQPLVHRIRDHHNLGRLVRAVGAQLVGLLGGGRRHQARTEAWVSALHLAEERKRLGLTQRQVAELMSVSPGRISQIENGDLDVNEVATLGRYARALGARMRIIFVYGNDLRQIA